MKNVSRKPSNQAIPFPLKSILKMALLSLRRHLIRSILALLGIVIGIAGLIITLALGEGASATLEKELLSMGKHAISIWSGNIFAYYDPRFRNQKPSPITLQDFEAIQAQVPNLIAATPLIEGSHKVQYQGQVLHIDVNGANEQVFKTDPRSINKGYYFNTYQAANGEKVAVLGSSAASSLFGMTNPLGKTIFIEDIPFTVIGVLDQKESRENSMRDPNMDLWVPFHAVWKKFKKSSNHDISGIILRARDPKFNPSIKNTIKRLLRFQHHLKDEQLDDFTIWDNNQMMVAAKKSSQTLHRFMFFAAGISLIVGGIGIMNILLVSMAERKNEIGLRMAIGATPALILWQFLIEAVVLCLLGGILGLLGGLAGAYIVGWVTGFPWLFHWPAAIIALSTTTAIGLTFGFYPAYRASQLHPIEALRTS